MVTDCKFPSSHICPRYLEEPGSSEDSQRNVCKDGCHSGWGGWFLKLNDRNSSAYGALVGEARDEAGTGQGEEEDGKPLRKSWTSCSIGLACGSQSWPGAKVQGPGRSVPSPSARSACLHTPPHTHMYLSLRVSAVRPLLPRNTGIPSSSMLTYRGQKVSSQPAVLPFQIGAE